jgi:large subunit ribosomal protein L28
MGRVCEFCEKRTTFGNTIARRGLAKYLGGVGVKKTGVSRRRFLANVQLLRVEIDGHVRRAKICTRCIKSGVVAKPKKRDIPEKTRAEMKAREEAKKPENRRKARVAARQERAAKAKAKEQSRKGGKKKA